ncbi:hypothetical protein Sgleb_17200 [Streptomyces glebosus]|uniref:Antitoxin YwqK n=2 Tax=Streptomyces TaxID=1883 RepID=A0A640SQE5_9ACTN|nr:hypothetical protein Sgleb_17200 [Streptomyces glebosus]GHG65196.1 hypothetical protein GCM10010513_33530 [Streptomyces glebosus]
MRVNREDTYNDEDMILHYEGEPFTGETVWHDKEGHLVRLETYLGGVASGPHTQWFPDGSKKKEGALRQGVPVGDWRTWYRNGQLAKHVTYSDTGVEQRYRAWDKDGTLVEDDAP